MTSDPVLISGSGPTGLYLALSLTRNGIPVRIIEKDLKFHNASRGAGVMPRTREVQHVLGIDQQILNWGGSTDMPVVTLYKMPGAREVIKQWRFVEPFDPTPSCPYGAAIAVPQMEHERVVREELARHNVFVELGRELKTFTQDEHGVTAEILAHTPEGEIITETFRAAFICGADGAHGPTRKVMKCTFIGMTEGADAMVLADHKVHGLDHEHWHMWMNRVPGGLSIGCRSLRDGKGTYNTVVMGFGGFDPSDIMKPGGLAKTFRDVVGRDDIEMEEPLSISYFHPSVRMVDKFDEGRAFVLGDAAHIHSPTGGQGLNSSVQDAFNLGWKIALAYKKLAPLSLLHTYTEERSPVIAEMLRKTSGIYLQTKDNQEDPSKGSFLRGGPLLQLGINYRWSSLILDTRTPDSGMTLEEKKANPYGERDTLLVAGDRAPQAPALADMNVGTETSLFDVFDNTQHTVLYFQASSSTQPSLAEVTAVVGALPERTVQLLVMLPHSSETTSHEVTNSEYRVMVDAQGHAFVGYKVKETDETNTVIVVRPDAYIGAIVKSSDEVKTYFSKIFAV